jgi:predicted SnoaL-like aldol condensation-catalyzing enzyme
MRKLTFPASAVLLLFLAGCNDSATVASASDNSKVQRNLDAQHTIIRAIESGNPAGIDSVVADDFVDHTDHGDVKGRDSLKAMVKMMADTKNKMKMETKHEVADENYVYSWMRFSGNSDGSMGMPPGPYDMTSIEVSRLNDGKIAEHWTFMDMQEMGKMMQQMQGMNMSGAKADSSKGKNK